MTMTRRLLVLALLLPNLLRAQQVARVAPNVTMTVWYPVPRTLAAFPRWWRDSVRAAFARALPPRDTPITGAPSGGYAAVKLQVLRSGALYDVDVEHSSGNAEIDSALVTAAQRASDAGALPAFPAAVDGAGREVHLIALLPDGPVTSSAGTREEPALLTDEVLADLPIPPLTPACDSQLRAPNRWQQTYLTARVATVSRGPGMKDWADRALTSFIEAFTPVGPVAAPGRPILLREHPAESELLPGRLHLELDAAGRIRSAALLTTTEIPALDSALLAFAHRVDSLGVVPPPTSTVHDSARMDLVFMASTRIFTGWTRLGALTLGEWAPDSVPQLARVGALRYPSALRSQGIGGRVTIDYVVGADGRAIPGSVFILATPHPAFEPAVRDLVLGSRYKPARIGACAIPILVRQNINFSP